MHIASNHLVLCHTTFQVYYLREHFSTISSVYVFYIIYPYVLSWGFDAKVIISTISKEWLKFLISPGLGVIPKEKCKDTVIDVLMVEWPNFTGKIKQPLLCAQFC